MKRILAHPAFHAAVIVVIGVLAYSGTLDVPFHLDDIPNIKENPIVYDLRYFLDTYAAEGHLMYDALRQRYVGFLTFALNNYYWGQGTTSYHVVNLCIHVLNALIVYVLVFLSFQTLVLRKSQLKNMSSWIAFFAAVLFVAHPVQTQAVTYIVQRLASLTALFYLGSMTAYIGARLSKRRIAQVGLYLAAFLLGVLAMKTKQNAFTLPLALVAYELIFFQGDWRKRLIWLVPILLTMSIIPLSVLAQDKPVLDTIHSMEEHAELFSMPRDQYLMTQTRVVSTYIRLLILPINQSLYYDYPLNYSFLETPVLLSILLHIILVLTAVVMLKAKRVEFRLISFGIFFFYLALSVESGLIPLYPIFEHRIYLPSVGVLIGISVFMIFLFSSLKRHKLRIPLIIFSIVIVLVMSTATWKRNIVWQSDLSLWRDVVSKAPGNARARNYLGNAYYMRGFLDEALEEYQAALRYVPTAAPVLRNIGLILLDQNRVEDSIKYFEESIRYQPFYGELVRYQPEKAYVYNNLGSAYMKLGKLDEAIKNLEAAVYFHPGFSAPHANLGICYFEQGRLNEAKRHLQIAISLKPDDLESRRLLAFIEKTGDKQM